MFSDLSHGLPSQYSASVLCCFKVYNEVLSQIEPYFIGAFSHLTGNCNPSYLQFDVSRQQKLVLLCRALVTWQKGTIL